MIDWNKMNRNWQNELRKKLEREAFNEKYECLICKKRENLHIHHLIYCENKEDYFNPNYWRILCKNCHAKTPKEKLKRIESILQNQLKGQNFRNLMKRLKTNKYRIARDTGISYRTLCSWQSNSSTPSEKSVMLVGKYLGLI